MYASTLTPLTLPLDYRTEPVRKMGSSASNLNVLTPCSTTSSHLDTRRDTEQPHSVRTQSDCAPMLLNAHIQSSLTRSELRATVHRCCSMHIYRAASLGQNSERLCTDAAQCTYTEQPHSVRTQSDCAPMLLNAHIQSSLTRSELRATVHRCCSMHIYRAASLGQNSERLCTDAAQCTYTEQPHSVRTQSDCAPMLLNAHIQSSLTRSELRATVHRCCSMHIYRAASLGQNSERLCTDAAQCTYTEQPHSVRTQSDCAPMLLNAHIQSSLTRSELRATVHRCCSMHIYRAASLGQNSERLCTDAAQCTYTEQPHSVRTQSDCAPMLLNAHIQSSLTRSELRATVHRCCSMHIYRAASLGQNSERLCTDAAQCTYTEQPHSVRTQSDCAPMLLNAHIQSSLTRSELRATVHRCCSMHIYRAASLGQNSERLCTDAAQCTYTEQPHSVRTQSDCAPMLLNAHIQSSLTRSELRATVHRCCSMHIYRAASLGQNSERLCTDAAQCTYTEQPHSVRTQSDCAPMLPNAHIQSSLTRSELRATVHRCCSMHIYRAASLGQNSERLCTDAAQCTLHRAASLGQNSERLCTDAAQCTYTEQPHSVRTQSDCAPMLLNAHIQSSLTRSELRATVHRCCSMHIYRAASLGQNSERLCTDAAQCTYTEQPHSVRTQSDCAPMLLNAHIQSSLTRSELRATVHRCCSMHIYRAASLGQNSERLCTDAAQCTYTEQPHSVRTQSDCAPMLLNAHIQSSLTRSELRATVHRCCSMHIAQRQSADTTIGR